MKVLFSLALLLVSASFAMGQLTLPRQSQKERVELSIGDVQVNVVYGRPNVRGRKVWGGLVPYNEVWRAGADENTTFEFSREVRINGQELPAGKYGFHVLPTEKEFVLIFSRDNDKWGSFTYQPGSDALRVSVMPESSDHHETLSYSFSDVSVSSAKAVISWEKIRIPFVIDIGDVHGRSISTIRNTISKRTADDIRPFSQGASYVLNFQLKTHYQEAISWLDEALKIRETFQLLSAKARLLAASGRIADAIATGERALAIGKAANPPANTADFERFVTGLRNQK